MNNSLLQLVIGIGAVTALVSCSKGFTAPSSYEEIQKESYKYNFETKYGAISPNQTWDFSKYELRLATTRGGSTINTEIMEKGIDFGDVSNLKLEHHTFSKAVWNYDIILSGITKNAALFDAINTNLPEKKKWVGNKAVLVAPCSSFYIYPLLSGGLNRFDLMVKVGRRRACMRFQ